MIEDLGMNKELQELTDDTIKAIRKLEIVLPEIYRDVFYTKAQERSITINEEDKEEALIYALRKIQKLSDETKESAHALKEHVTQAKTAVQDKDDKALATIESDIIELEKRVDQLQKEVYLDTLTSLYNRRWLFEKFLDEDLFTDQGTFAFIDIDNFKAINDEYGHATGDKVLYLLAKVLKRLEGTKAIRFAGDEFVIISTKLSEKSVKSLLERVQKNLAETALKTSNKSFHIKFSFGITSFTKGTTFKDVYQEADELMYAYKSKGN